jgi:1,4-alpha-glucan branching enzyme
MTYQLSVNQTQQQATDGYVSLITNDDLYLFNEGSHFHLYEKLGSHSITVNGVEGTYFAVWAPNAREVFVKGDFNGWQDYGHRLSLKEHSGFGKALFLE